MAVLTYTGTGVAVACSQPVQCGLSFDPTALCRPLAWVLGLGSWGRRGDWVLGLGVSQRAGSWVLGLGSAGGRIFASELLEKQKIFVMEQGKIGKFFHFCLQNLQHRTSRTFIALVRIGSDVGLGGHGDFFRLQY